MFCIYLIKWQSSICCRHSMAEICAPLGALFQAFSVCLNHWEESEPGNHLFSNVSFGELLQSIETRILYITHHYNFLRGKLLTSSRRTACYSFLSTHNTEVGIQNKLNPNAASIPGVCTGVHYFLLPFTFFATLLPSVPPLKGHYGDTCSNCSVL